ncbi:MAG: hypothetical protein WC734_02385 [Patescibacteria group bacterium]|jgi:hypothetical protein
MSREIEIHPIQENLFPTEPAKSGSERSEKHDGEAPEVDHINHRVRLEVEGYVLTCALRNGKINIDAVEGTADKRDVPRAVIARAKKWAGGILRKAA